MVWKRDFIKVQIQDDNNAIQSIEMTTQDGEDSTVSRHVFFDTDYATSLAALVALETPAV